MDTLVRRFRHVLAAAFVTALFLGAGPQAAGAQTQWRQRFQIIAPVEQNSVASALRDSIVDVSRREGVRLRREPKDASPLPIRQLEDELFNEGVDFSSANRMFLRYDFRAERGDLRRDIEELYFIYRPEGAQGNDVPIMAVDATEPHIARLLASSGVKLRTNEAALDSFRDQLMFHKLPDSQLVSLGGQVIRDPEEAERQRRRLLQTVERFLY